MPAKSAAQFRLMKGIASGSIPPKGSLTKSVASEYVGHQSPKGLPEHKSPSDERKSMIRSPKKKEK